MKNRLIILMAFIFIISLSSVNAGLIDDITAYWKFDGTSGPVLDSVSGVYNGTDIGGILRGEFGLINNAINFTNTVDSYINLTTPTFVCMGDLNCSVSLWFNSSSVNAHQIYQQGRSHNDNAVNIGSSGNGTLKIEIYNDASGVTNTHGDPIVNGYWQHIVVVLNTSSVLVYQNGTLRAQRAIVGTMGEVAKVETFGININDVGSTRGLVDEVGIWNRSLTVSEVSELFNNGVGLAFPFTGFSVTLNKPVNSFKTTENEIIFNATLNPINVNLTNATFFLWNSTNDLINVTTNIITGEVANTTLFNISNIDFGNYQWNVLGSGVDSSGVNSSFFAPTNFTFEIEKFSILNQFFNFNASETDDEFFEINISTISDITSVSANLIYNGTPHLATSNCDDAGLCNIKTNIDIPLIQGTAESQNKTFFWEIVVFNSVNLIFSNTTLSEQNVSRIHLEECDATFTVLALNFTASNEQNSTRIDPFNFDGTFNTWLGNGKIRRNDSFSSSSTSEVNLCITPPDRNFNIDATIEYNDEPNSTLYQTRNYFFQNDTINNATQDIPLNLLLASVATSFILKVQDSNLLALANVLVFSQRFNAGTGNFTTVQVAKTDDNGQSVGFFETEVVDYRFLIKRNGLLLLQTAPQKMVGETAPFTLTFTVGEGAAKPWELFEDLPNLEATLVFSKGTNQVEFTFIDTSGTFTLARLLVETQNFSIPGSVICDLNSTQASGILTCPLGNITGNYLARGFIDRSDGQILVGLINFAIETFVIIVGLLGVFLGWMIILISSFAFKFNELAGIWLVNAAVIMVNMMQLVSFGMIFIFGMIAVSIIITVMFNKAQ